MTRKREVLAGEDISDLPPPSHRHPMSGEPIWDQHAVRAALSKLRAPVADERAAFEAAYKRRQGTPIDLELLRDGDGYTDGADGARNLNVAWETWQDARAALASAPVADGEWPTLSDLHLQALMFAYNEGYSKAIDGRKFKNPFETSGSQAAAWELGTQDGTEARSKMESTPVAGYIKPDPAAPTHPRYVSELKYRSAADAEADPEGKGWLKVYAAPQASPVAGEAVAEMLVTNIGCKVTTLNAANYLPNGTYQLYAAPQASAEDVRELPDAEMRTLIGNYFADDWAKEAAAGLLHDYACALKTQADKDGGQQRNWVSDWSAAIKSLPMGRADAEGIRSSSNACMYRNECRAMLDRLRAAFDHPVFAFLLGEGPLHGVHFGDRHPSERGAYWWRKDLRAALSAPQAEQGERDAN